MLGEEQGHQDPYLSVLEEIKQLMDDRLGSRLGEKPESGIAIEKVEVQPEGSPEEEAMETPAHEADEDSMGLGDDEMEQLKKIRMGM